MNILKDIQGINRIDKAYVLIRDSMSGLKSVISPYFRRAFRFLLLPYCFVFLIDWDKCDKPKGKVFFDFLYIFFVLKYFPDNYFQCRFYKIPRSKWKYYYGSTYEPFQRAKLRKFVQPKEYEVLYEDKWVCQLLCDCNEIRAPQSLGIFGPGHLSFQDLRQIVLKHPNKKQFIAKPINGKGGHSIKIINVEEERVLVKHDFGQNQELDVKTFNEPHIVQEFVGQHPDLSAYCHSVNTTRLVTLLAPDGEVLIVGSYVRFSNGDAMVDNLSQGGLAVSVDRVEGTLAEFAYDRKGNSYATHPKSGLEFKNFRVPFWEQVISLGKNTQRKLGFSRLLGMDIAVTPQGPLIIEINFGYDNVDLEEVCGPILQDESVFKAFNDYDLLINKHQKSLFKN